MFQNIGWLEITIILLVVLVLFGGKLLPKAGKELGESGRELKKATKELKEVVKE
ncbi:MAG: twin-arginine translocase TatA/TatE family subunit [Microgenomates group bacterium]